MTKYAYRTNATDSLWANTAMASTADSIRLSNIANPSSATTYTFRIWGVDTTCYTDKSVVLSSTICTSNINLVLSKTVDSSIVSTAGQVVNFRLKVKNTSLTNATGVTVKVIPTVGFTFVAATPSVSYAAATGIWTIGNINAGDSAILTLTVRADSTGVNYCTAEIASADQTDINSTPNNNNSEEDDIARICVSVPIKLCTGMSFTAALPNTLTGIKWFKNGIEIAGQTSNSLIISTTGDYTFIANESTCPLEGCCPLKIIVGSCTILCKPVICLPVLVMRQ